MPVHSHVATPTPLINIIDLFSGRDRRASLSFSLRLLIRLHKLTKKQWHRGLCVCPQPQAHSKTLFILHKLLKKQSHKGLCIAIQTHRHRPLSLTQIRHPPTWTKTVLIYSDESTTHFPSSCIAIYKTRPRGQTLVSSTYRTKQHV